jgi:uncharacterized protein (TIGR04222 family)
MNASQQELFDRLNAFEFDEPGTELTFGRRLARENGWSLAYARRVIEEYKRFLWLACTAGHVVTPSEQVDQAWHLHLTYTRSYWDDLCRNVLHQALHHGPTKGGTAEQEKFVDLYEQTLMSYRKMLGQEPPSDVWSPAEQRFGEDLRHVSVNTQRNWVIPKPRWPQSLSRSTPLLALGLFGLPLAAITWNPLDWNGPEFLVGYVLLTIIAAVVAYVVRCMLVPDTIAEEAKFGQPLDPYEAACLAAGPARSVQAAFAALVHAGMLQIVGEESKVCGLFTTKKNFIRQGKPLPENAHRLERAMFQAAAMPADDIAPLTAAGMPIAVEINDELVKRGLLQAGPPPVCNVAASLIMATPLLLGGAKIAVGLSRGRPVELLVALCVLTFIAALVFLLARSRLSVAGKATLKSLQAKHSTTKQFATSASETLAPPDLAMAIGLFGIGMLATGPLAEVHAMLPRATGGGGCSGSIGGCGGGGGGCAGGGCGGGGCGGGGCGGCGGG